MRWPCPFRSSEPRSLDPLDFRLDVRQEISLAPGSGYDIRLQMTVPARPLREVPGIAQRIGWEIDEDVHIAIESHIAARGRPEQQEPAAMLPCISCQRRPQVVHCVAPTPGLRRLPLGQGDDPIHPG